jgi:hypothetical protein
MQDEGVYIAGKHRGATVLSDVSNPVNLLKCDILETTCATPVT